METSTLLNSDDEAREPILKADMDDIEPPESTLKRIRRYLWPETPLIFRPALAYLLILLMIFPVYRGLKMPEGTDLIAVHERPASGISMVQNISLQSGRSAKVSVLKISDGMDGLLDFVWEDAVEDANYSVSVESQDGTVLFRTDAFNAFDDYGKGILKFPLDLMEPGNYWVKVVDPRADPPFNEKQYPFRIEP